MIPTVGRPPVLDDRKKATLCGLLAAGVSRANAARYVGCAVNTIANTAQREPAFEAQLLHAESQAEMFLVNVMHEACIENWRAAAWMLEHKFPEEYARARRDTITRKQLEEVKAEWLETAMQFIPRHMRPAAIDALCDEADTDDMLAEYGDKDPDGWGLSEEEDPYSARNVLAGLSPKGGSNGHIAANSLAAPTLNAAPQGQPASPPAAAAEKPAISPPHAASASLGAGTRDDLVNMAKGAQAVSAPASSGAGRKPASSVAGKAATALAYLAAILCGSPLALGKTSTADDRPPQANCRTAEPNQRASRQANRAGILAGPELLSSKTTPFPLESSTIDALTARCSKSESSRGSVLRSHVAAPSEHGRLARWRDWVVLLTFRMKVAPTPNAWKAAR